MLFKKRSIENEEKYYASLRQDMVNEQIIARGISDERTIQALLKVPRHIFVPQSMLGEAYADYPLPIGQGQTISQPYMVALMTELFQLEGNEKILEIGTGSGYQTAILAELAKKVYTIERFSELIEQAKKRLQKLGYENILFFCSDGTKGLPEFAPYQGIIVTASAKEIPPPLFQQLDEGGKLVIPLGERFSQILTLVEKKKGKTIQKEICGCTFVPLVGEYGWGQ